MSESIEWERPSGSKITLKNTQSLNSYAEKAGWKKAKKPKKAAKNDNSATDSKRGSRGNRSKDS